MEEILDPRLRRLDLQTGALPAKDKLDQLPTYEVFVQIKDPRPYKHEGCVHASSLPMAMVFAKEQFSRRGMCSGIWVVATGDILVTDYSDNDRDVYDSVTERKATGNIEYVIFQMIKRGTQHKVAGTVTAASAEEALAASKGMIERPKPVLNVWIAKATDILKTTPEDIVMWETTPKKLFREAIDYKTQEKLNQYKAEQS